MSAYIVDRKHVVYLVQSALTFAMKARGGGFSWVAKDPTKPGGYRREKIEHGGDFARAASAANMLWMENIKSVSHRYPNESNATLPGPIGEDFVIKASAFKICAAQPDLAQLFKAIDCFCYQSCEHDEWEQSEAFAFCQALRETAWSSLPGYEDAAWGAPEPVRVRRAA